MIHSSSTHYVRRATRGCKTGSAVNNQAKKPHLPLRRRERAVQGFRSPRGLQRFVSVLCAVRNLLVRPRCRRSAVATNLHRLDAMVQRGAVANLAAWIQQATETASMRPIPVGVTLPIDDREIVGERPRQIVDRWRRMMAPREPQKVPAHRGRTIEHRRGVLDPLLELDPGGRQPFPVRHDARAETAALG
jgi:hypothetical protein